MIIRDINKAYYETKNAKNSLRKETNKWKLRKVTRV